MKVDRSILMRNDQNMGDIGDPDKLENSIEHLANVIDGNANAQDSLSKDNTQNKTDITSLKSRATTLETDNTSNKERIGTNENRISSVQNQVNQLVVSGDSGPEAAQARVTAKGKVFTTLQERLNDSDAQLAETVKNAKQPSWQYKGVNFTSFVGGGFASSKTDEDLVALKSMGVDTIIVNQIGQMETYTSNAITSTRIPDSEVELAIQKAKNLGFKVCLKPMVDVDDRTWRANISPSNTDTWFVNFQNWLMNYVSMANRNNIEMFCLGAEMKSMTVGKYRSKWESLISQVRQNFSGFLTYGAHFGNAYERDEIFTCCFFDLLDYVGVQVWQKHTNKNDPTVSEIVDSWANNSDNRGILKLFFDWQKTHKKPIIFTECGMNAVDGGNKEPGKWNYPVQPPKDWEEQKDWYKAFFEVWKHHTDILKGVFFWSQNVNYDDDGYNVVNKPSGAIITEYWRDE